MSAPSTTLQFLQDLYPDDCPGFLPICTFSAGKPTVHWFPTDALEQAAARTADLSENLDTYFGIGLHGEPKGDRRGSAGDVVALPGFWMELDWLHPAHKANNLPPTRADVVSLLGDFPLEPTKIIDSGHGLHAWWLFREPWIFESEGDNAEAAQMSRRFQRWFINRARELGWTLDNTADLARVLRPPGTVNHKLEPIPVVNMMNNGPRYNPSDFALYLDTETTPTNGTHNGTPTNGTPSVSRHDELRRLSVKMSTIGLPQDASVAALTVIRDRHLQKDGRTIPDRELESLVVTAGKKFPPVEELDLEAIFGPGDSLDGWEQATPTRWLIEGALVRGGVTSTSSIGGGCKSLTTLIAAIQLAAGHGGDWFGFRLCEGPVRIAIIEAENGINRTRRRLQELVIGGQFSADVVRRASANIRVFSAGTIGHRELIFESLKQFIEADGYSVVIVDPLRSFLPVTVEDENNNLQVGRCIDHLEAIAKQTAAAIWIIDHDSKIGSPMRGASAKGDAAEITLHLTRPNEDDPDLFELKQTKSRDPGGQFKTSLRRICGTPTSDNLRPVRFERIAPGATEGSAAQTIIAWLIENGPAAQTAIATGTRLPINTVKSAIRKLTRGDEVLIVTGQTRYGSPVLAVRGSFSQVTKGDEL